MRAAESWMSLWLVAYLLNSLWQIPFVFAAAWIAARLARLVNPRVEHRVWVVALILGATLPICRHNRDGLWQHAWNLVLWRSRSGGAPGGQTHATIGAATASGIAMLQIPAPLLATLIAAYLITVIYFLGRLAWGLWRTSVLLRQAYPLTLTDVAAAKLERCRKRVGIVGPVRIATSCEIPVPVTFGIRRCTLLLPTGFLDKINVDDLDALFAHELAHMRRLDFAKNLLYELISLPVAYHPLSWLTRSHLAETREMICDLTAAESLSSRESYTRSLLRLASMLSDPTLPKTLHAIGMFGANILERRVMSLIGRRFEIRSLWRAAIFSACAALALATCLSAMAFRLNVDQPAAKPKTIHVDPKNLIIVYKKQPVYPEEAKTNNDTLNGAVVLAVTIGKEGTAEHIEIEKSLRDDYDQSAMDAVREWRWQPYLVNGEAVEVDTTIRVIYSLEK